MAVNRVHAGTQLFAALLGSSNYLLRLTNRPVGAPMIAATLAGVLGVGTVYALVFGGIGPAGTCPKGSAVPWLPAGWALALASAAGALWFARWRGRRDAARDEEFRMVFDGSSEGLYLVQVEGEDRYRFLRANAAFLRLAGLPADPIDGKRVEDVLPPGWLEVMMRHCREAIHGRRTVHWEEGEVPFAEGRGGEGLLTPLADASGAIHRLVGVVREVSPRQEAAARAEASERQLRALSRRLVTVQETERRRIARELHDEIGQALTVAQLNLQSVLQAPDAGSATVRLMDTLAVVERVLEQVHDISLDLRPSMLDELGLEPALLWYTTRHSELAGLRARFSMEPLDRRLDPVLETECFRIVQEALTNVVRHARARQVSVELRTEDGRLHLRVRDDGIGFDVAAVREQAVRGASLGLLSMEERASLAGGRLEFKSAPGEGTEVEVWFPLAWRTARSQSGEK